MFIAKGILSQSFVCQGVGFIFIRFCCCKSVNSLYNINDKRIFFVNNKIEKKKLKKILMSPSLAVRIQNDRMFSYFAKLYYISYYFQKMYG